MCTQVAILDDLKNFIKALFCVLKKVVFVTAVPKGKEYLPLKKRHCKYTKLLQYVGYLDIKFNKVELNSSFFNTIRSALNPDLKSIILNIL